MIEFKKVTKSYHSLTALNSVDLSIPKGEVVGLLGPNGAGKSTLIKLIAGIVNPTAGEVRAMGANADWPSIGYKPERLVFPGNQTTNQYLEMIAGLSNVGRQHIDIAVLEGLSRVNLFSAATRPIKNLSKGMRQRLGLAQALLGNPELILLDEPTNGLDPEGQEEIQSYIRALHRDGKTIVMASHRLEEVTRVCTHVIILKKGEVEYNEAMAKALSLRPHIAIQIDRPLGDASRLLTQIHEDVFVDGVEIILRNEAMAMRRQILSMLINQGHDVITVEQRMATLAEIYSGVVK
ncbi:MAG TPA: ABC transporter ATP-binding protein [Promineifilum sp.]